jgi:hypothetical protein
LEQTDATYDNAAQLGRIFSDPTTIAIFLGSLAVQGKSVPTTRGQLCGQLACQLLQVAQMLILRGLPIKLAPLAFSADINDLVVGSGD